VEKILAGKVCVINGRSISAYYHRFGFKTAANFGLKHKLSIPNENVMECELVPDALYGISGTAVDI
jgi:predicted N-acetyltransferase YhbS